MATPIPPTMRAVVLNSTSSPATVQTLPIPTTTPGSAVVKMLSASTISYMREVYNSTRPHLFPTPFVPGLSALGRVISVGHDATATKVGDLVLVDPFIRSRDGDGDAIIAGFSSGGTPGSEKLMHECWRDWTFAEYCRAPVENVFVLDEERLMGERGYAEAQLLYASLLMVPYGGLRDIDLQAGETVVIAPATGPFGSGGVLVALAMGGRVVAMGRDGGKLEDLRERVGATKGRLKIVRITGDVAADSAALKSAAGGECDAYLDIGPAEAGGSTHIKSAMLALRQGGKVSLMGGYRQDIPIPHSAIMRKSLRLHGKWMYERSDVKGFLKMVEAGLVDLGVCEVAGEFGLEDWGRALDVAAEKGGFGKIVVVRP